MPKRGGAARGTAVAVLSRDGGCLAGPPTVLGSRDVKNGVSTQARRRKEGIPACGEVMVLEKSQGHWEKRLVSGGG